MIATMIRASLARNRLVSAFMAGFLVLSTALLAAAAILTAALFGSVTGFMDTAQTPHFMQMHSGPVDGPRLQRFAEGRPEVEAFEDVQILNVDNAALTFGGHSLDAEIQQNSFATQGRRMDFLLAEDGTRLQPEAGQVYLPFFYEDKYALHPGDRVDVALPDGTTEFTVADFFRDSQMNSTLASSKRLLISDADYQRLAGQPGTSPEHLVSFRLHDPLQATAVETAYHDAGLEADGPALTWDMFVLINSINDGITALLFALMAFVILLICFLCIRYTLLTTLEEDLREIGVMKALGVANRQVRAIYLGKYRVLLGSGAAVGFLLALAARGPLLANARRQLGEISHPVLGVVAAAAGAFLLYALSMGYVRRVLTRLGRIAPLQALQGISGLVPARRRPRQVLPPATGPAVNRKLAFASIRRDPARHLTILAVAFLVTLVLLVPFRIAGTAASEKFVTYMGMGAYDLRIDLLNRPDALAVAGQVTDALAGDGRVGQVETYRLETEEVSAHGGPAQPVRIDYGDPQAFPLRYADGRAPRTATEIGLSELNAEGLGVTTGDGLRIAGPDGPVGFTVSGIYQDVTNGGKTAKALPGPTMDSATPAVMIAIGTDDPAGVAELVSATRPDVPVIDTRNYLSQLLGGLIGTLNVVAWVFSVVAVLIAALIAGVSIRLMLVTERKATAVMGALGFTTGQLRGQYLLRIMTMMAAGVLLAVALAGPLGNVVSAVVFGPMGLSGISLEFSPLTTLLGSGLVLAGAWAVTALNTRSGFNTGLAERLRA